MQRRYFLITAGGTGLALPAAASVEDIAWTDAARSRTLPLRVRWPAGDAPCALVLHSHGLGGNREGGDVWGQAWRAAGIAVIHVQHPGSDTDALRRGGADALREATRPEQLVARVADLHFVIDEALRRAAAGESPWRRVRADAIGLSGHSFGAGTVQAAAGKRYGVATPGFAESRAKAFIAFSPAPDRQQRQTLQEQFGAIERPFLVVTGSHDGDPLPWRRGKASTPEVRASVYDGLPSGRRALLWLQDADHMTFGGNGQVRLAARRGPLQREPEAMAQEPTHHERVARVTTLWWRAHLQSDASAAAALRNASGLGLGMQDRWQVD
jgi:predicted dienelactone hydrolase